jgi:hypothetical protein
LRDPTRASTVWCPTLVLVTMARKIKKKRSDEAADHSLFSGGIRTRIGRCSYHEFFE